MFDWLFNANLNIVYREHNIIGLILLANLIVQITLNQEKRF